MSEHVYNIIGLLGVTTVSSVAAAYCLFMFFGKNWIKHQFAKDLADAKAELSFLNSKRLKLNDKEYEVFPEIWARLIKVREDIYRVSDSSRSVPVFDSTAKTEIDTWLTKSDFTDDEKEYFLSTSNYMGAYHHILDIRQLKKSHASYCKFNDYYQENKIFISPDIKKDIDEIYAKLDRLWLLQNQRINYPIKFNPTQIDKRNLETEALQYKELPPLFETLEQTVQDKLFPESKGKK